MEAQEKGKKLSKVELAMQSDDPGMLKGWQRKGGKVSGCHTARSSTEKVIFHDIVITVLD